MLPLKERDKPLVKKLLSAGCCVRCVLRFCCVMVHSAYRQSYEDTVKELQAFISDSENDKSKDSAVPEPTGENNKSHDAMVPDSTGENNGSQDATVPELSEDPPSKKFKLDPTETDVQSEGGTAVVPMATEEAADVCVVCLGILQEFSGKSHAVKIAEAVKAENYQFNSMVLFVSLPAQLGVREHSCWLHVKKEVREKRMALDRDDVIQVKEAFKWIMQGLVSRELGGVDITARSEFEVGIGFTHAETEADCHFLAGACPDCFRPTKNKQSLFTRAAVVKALEKISDQDFMTNYPCPPTRPATKCTAQDVQCTHVSVFVAGRYNKFCRSLPQTPWVIDGERKMESSVEELIAAPILSVFRADVFNFSSSGREDVDVRTLGNGRPFAMELLNPHRSRFNKAEIRQIQETINQSSDKIRVRDLQIVSREAMGRMKEGEEEKTKSYTALVWTQKAIQKEDIAFIGEIKELTIDQKTPLRVLHRRALAVRQRVIHNMSTRFKDPHHFYLGLKTQAGTYIKEFVHGDFGRTKPNLCELLKTDADILELDVESVDVDWPPAIPE